MVNEGVGMLPPDGETLQISKPVTTTREFDELQQPQQEEEEEEERDARG